MNSEHNNSNKPNPWHYFFFMVGFMAIIFGLLFFAAGCSPKVVTHTETIIEYRDTTIRDTAYFEVPVEVEKIVTRDTTSHLENSLAISDAMVTDGFLHHSLETKPQKVPVPVVIHVRDTIKQESQIVYKEVPVQQPLSWWQKFEIGAFWWLRGAVLLLLLWTFRKLIF